MTDENENESNDDATRVSDFGDSDGHTRTGEHDHDHDHLGSRGHVHSERARYWLTNDLLTIPIALSVPVIVGLASIGQLDLSAVPAEVRGVWLGMAGVATIWLYGTDSATAWRKFRGGGSGGGR
jgi:hypothetical protein